MNKNFNIVIQGVGGQGVITLVSILDEAAFAEGFDVKSSELHGLSQRGGSVEVHVRFGKRIFSPLVKKADLIIGLELTEGLRGCKFAGKDTIFLVNDNLIPFMGGISEKEAKDKLNQVTDNLHLVSASQICKKELSSDMVSGIYLLGYAAHKKLIPIKPEHFLKAIEKMMPEKYLDLNIKAFHLAKET